MPLDRTVAIVDPDEAVQELGLTDAEYPRVERLVNSASARLERSLVTVIRPREAVRWFSGDGSPVLDVGAPIVAVHNVTVGGAVVDPAAYVVEPETGRILLTGGGWPVGIRNIMVDARLGMEPVPHEAREACLLLVRRLAFPALDLRGERIGDYSYERFEPKGDADIPDDVEALVGHLRRWRFG